MATRKVIKKHPETGAEHEVEEDDNAQQDPDTNVDKQLKERSPEQVALDAAADQRSASGGQSGFGSAVPAKLAEEHGVTKTGDPDIPHTKDESEAARRKREKDKKDSD